MEININQDKCTRCAKCSKVCPSAVFIVNDEKQIEAYQVAACIGCGHCAAVCEYQAVEHSLFPKITIHPYDRSSLPDPMALMTLIKARRSTRVFQQKQIPSDILDNIVQAAYRAPTASNAQGLGFTLITDPAKILEVSRFTVDTFASIVKKIDNPLMRPLIGTFAPSIMRYLPAFKKIRREFDAGNDLILRRATALLLIHAPKSSRFGAEDSNLAYQNGSLMAECMGVGQFYTGFVLSAVRQKRGMLEGLLGIDGKICAGMALGLPAVNYPSYVDRKDIAINKI